MGDDEQTSSEFEHETRIRNYYSQNIARLRPGERLLDTEHSYPGNRLRVDMRTVDTYNCIREWEFKITADYKALGQILTYVALSRQHYQFRRTVRGVVAAFTFMPEVVTAIEVMNLGIELVTIPPSMRFAGNIPADQTPHASIVDIPVDDK